MPTNPKHKPEGVNNHKKAILKTLLEHCFFLTTRQAAQHAGVSWVTADKYLRELEQCGWVSHTNRNGKDYWKAEAE